MGMIVAVMMIAMMTAKVRWISRKEGRSYKNCAVCCNGDHTFQFPCSDDRSTIEANVKCSLISSSHYKTRLISEPPAWTAREMKLIQGANFYKSNAE